MQYAIEEICDFLADQTGTKRERIRDDTDITKDLGVDGDDWDDLLAAYRERFGVNLDGFLWYFHHGEEGFNLFGLVFWPPYWRVKRIPITPRILLESANQGHWCISYPPHTIPKHRYDMWANLGCLVVFLAVVIASWIYRMATAR